MRSPLHDRIAAGAMALLMAAPAIAGTNALPLPARTDIPAEFSTTLCPSSDRAVAMLDFITVNPPPNDHIADTRRFFAGLAATGCAQDGTQRNQPITITQVLARKTVTLAHGPERHIAYAGRDAEGRILFGIVDESGNDSFPRTPLQRWLRNQGSDDGLLTIAEPAEYGTRAYACATAAVAQSAVRAIPTGARISDKAKEQAFMQAVKAGKCLSAKGRFRVRAILDERAIGCGEECEANWTALEAFDSKGAVVGLIYDASLM